MLQHAVSRSKATSACKAAAAHGQAWHLGLLHARQLCEDNSTCLLAEAGGRVFQRGSTGRAGQRQDRLNESWGLSFGDAAVGADSFSGDRRSSHCPGGMPRLVAAVGMACTKCNTLCNFSTDSQQGGLVRLAVIC